MYQKVPDSPRRYTPPPPLKDRQLDFAGIIETRYQDLSEKIKDINKRVRRYCHSKGFFFLDNTDVDENRTKVYCI